MRIKLFLFVLCIFFSPWNWAGEAARIVFLAGDVAVDGRAARLGNVVHEGQELRAGEDGYVYLKTADDGFLILRPNSVGRILAYRIDPANPAASQFRIELVSGVARHVSGSAVQHSKDNFRFNTPVAAIGVRGTDFTVFATAETTRVAVVSGGVVVSPFTGTCVRDASGPCEGALSRELFAGRTGSVLSVTPGRAPVLLNGQEYVPDAVVPPGPDENTKVKPTSAASTSKVGNDSSLEPLKLGQLQEMVATALAGDSGDRPKLSWGRWQAVLDQKVQVDIEALRATSELIAVNAYHAIMRDSDGNWRAPIQAEFGFALAGGQAMIVDQSSRNVSLPQLQNGVLRVNFATSSFLTRFDLVSGNERLVLQNQGEVSNDGRLYGGYQFLRPNNMDVRGALAKDNSTAAYLFQSRLDDNRIASGVTYWTK